MHLDTAIRAYALAHRHLLTAGTLRGRRYALESFARHVGPDMAVRAVRPKHVSEWIESLEVAASTMRKQVSAIKCLWAWLILSGHARIDPTVGVKVPRQPKALPRTIDAAAITRLYGQLPDARAVVIVSFMLHEGLRCAEVAGLEMSDLDLVNNVMRVVGKGSVEALLPITPPTRDALIEYFGVRGRSAGAVVRSEAGNVGLTPAHVGQLVHDWMTDAGLKQGPHDGVSAHALRHTFASRLYDRDVDLQVISEALRHANPSTTWTYLRHRRSLDTLRDAMSSDGGGGAKKASLENCVS